MRFTSTYSRLHPSGHGIKSRCPAWFNPVHNHLIANLDVISPGVVDRSMHYLLHLRSSYLFSFFLVERLVALGSRRCLLSGPASVFQRVYHLCRSIILLSHPGGMRLCTECGTQTHTVKSIPTKPPAFDTQFFGRDSSFLRRPDQVCTTSCFGIAFRPYFGCVILQSSSSLVFITSFPLFLTSRVGDIFPSFWITLSHLSLHIKWADSAIGTRYRRVFPSFISPSSCLNVTAGLPKILPRSGLIDASGDHLILFPHHLLYIIMSILVQPSLLSSWPVTTPPK